MIVRTAHFHMDSCSYIHMTVYMNYILQLYTNIGFITCIINCMINDRPINCTQSVGVEVKTEIIIQQKTEIIIQPWNVLIALESVIK